MIARPGAGIRHRDLYMFAGVTSVILGGACVDFLPPLGLLEVVVGVCMLATRRPGAGVAGLASTTLILASAVKTMATDSGPANPIMLPIAIVSLVVVGALIWHSVATLSSHTR